MDTVQLIATLLTLVVFLAPDVTGVCPVNNITSVIDMCSGGTVSGYGIFVDIPQMPSNVSSCACTVSSEILQTVQVTTMEVLDETPRDCDFYTYSIQNPLNTTHTWTCQNPGGFAFATDEIDPNAPWSVNMSKTLTGLFFAPPTDPNYCVVLVPVQGRGREYVYGYNSTGAITLTCGETTPVGDLPSTSTITTGDNTATTTDEETTQPATPARQESGNTGVTDTGLGIILGGIFAAVLLFFLIVTALYFCNRRKKEEVESDRVSVVTATTNAAGYPYKQQGGRYVYYLDTSSYRPDYLYEN